MAFQGGVDIPLPVGRFANLTLQYTYLGPFFYSHYPVEIVTGQADGKDVVETWDVSYVNKGRPLGYPMQPNSDEVLLRGTLGIQGGWEFEALVKYQRRSGQYGISMTDNMIYADQKAGKYADKAFNENVFERLVSIEVGAVKRFESLPFALTGTYLFHEQWNRERTAPTDGTHNYTVTGPWIFGRRSHALQVGIRLWY